MKYDCVILNVPHKDFLDNSSMYIDSVSDEKTVLIDVKGLLDNKVNVGSYQRL